MRKVVESQSFLMTLTYDVLESGQFHEGGESTLVNLFDCVHLGIMELNISLPVRVAVFVLALFASVSFGVSFALTSGGFN